MKTMARIGGLADAAGGFGRGMAVLLLVLANALWGSAWTVAKIATAELDPPLLAALRMTLATSLFWGVWLWDRARRIDQPAAHAPLARGDLLRMLGLGIFGLGISYPLIYGGLGLTTASDGSLMIIGEVIFTTLLAALIAHEPLDRRKLGGVALGMLGVVVLVLGGAAASDTAGKARLTGDILVLAGLFLQALLSVIGANLARRTSTFTMSALVYGGSLLVWLPLLAWYGIRGELAGISTSAIWSIIYLAAIPSVACNLIWFAVIRRYGASLGAITLCVQPLVGAALGVVVLQEPVTTVLLGGGALIIAALGLLVGVGRKRDER